MKKTLVTIVKMVMTAVALFAFGYIATTYIDGSYLVNNYDVIRYAVRAWMLGSIGYSLAKLIQAIGKAVAETLYDLERWAISDKENKAA